MGSRATALLLLLLFAAGACDSDSTPRPAARDERTTPTRTDETVDVLGRILFADTADGRDSPALTASTATLIAANDRRSLTRLVDDEKILALVAPARFQDEIVVIYRTTVGGCAHALGPVTFDPTHRRIDFAVEPTSDGSCLGIGVPYLAIFTVRRGRIGEATIAIRDPTCAAARCGAGTVVIDPTARIGAAVSSVVRPDDASDTSCRLWRARLSWHDAVERRARHLGLSRLPSDDDRYAFLDDPSRPVGSPTGVTALMVDEPSGIGLPGASIRARGVRPSTRDCRLRFVVAALTIVERGTALPPSAMEGPTLRLVEGIEGSDGERTLVVDAHLVDASR